MTQLAIEVQNLKKSFRKRNGFFKAAKFWALNDVSFTVAQGETYGLLGRLCARIGFLARGKLVAEGTAAELKEKAGVDSLDDAFIKLTGEELKTEEDEVKETAELEEV